MVFLLVAPGPLAEVLSQNVPLLTYLQPVPFLLVTLTYGVPVLLIRELAVARNLNALGVALLGLAYGILNEGVLAKTLTQPDGAPLVEFAGYGQIGSLQGGWTVFIVFWHSLHSVLYPILLCSWMFPAASGRRWFVSREGRWLRRVLVTLLICLYSLYFLNPARSEVDIFILYAIATAALVGIALRFCRARVASPSDPPSTPSLRPALLGGCMLVFYVLQFLSPRHIPFALYLVISAGTIALSAGLMFRSKWRPLPDLLLFGLGDCVAFAAFSSWLHVVSGPDPLQAAAAGAVFLVAFVYLLREVRREPLGRDAIRPAPSNQH